MRQWSTRRRTEKAVLVSQVGWLFRLPSGWMDGVWRCLRVSLELGISRSSWKIQWLSFFFSPIIYRLISCHTNWSTESWRTWREPSPLSVKRERKSIFLWKFSHPIFVVVFYSLKLKSSSKSTKSTGKLCIRMKWLSTGHLISQSSPGNPFKGQKIAENPFILFSLNFDRLIHLHCLHWFAPMHLNQLLPVLVLYPDTELSYPRVSQAKLEYFPICGAMGKSPFSPTAKSTMQRVKQPPE